MKRNIILLALILGAVGVSEAQVVRPPTPRASQKATVMQTLGTTEVSITYSRPAVKGRRIWGDWPADVKGQATLDDGRSRPKDAPIVPYGHIWRAGANEATLFQVADDVLIDGQPLAAGRYSLHMLPTMAEWTVIFNKDDGQWGSFDYDEKKDALRIKVKPEWAADSQELLTYVIEPDVPDADGAATSKAAVMLRWEKVRVPFTVAVKDPVGATIARLKAYVAAAKPDDAGARISAGNYARGNKQTDLAKAWFEEALKITDAQIAAKESFQNLQRKATILLNLNRGADALAAAERAVVVGKADPAIKPADIAALEKRIADLKAGKQ